jgi:hypothetical protein
MTLDNLNRMREQSWRVDGSSRLPDPTAAKEYIDRLGIVTLYHASAEVPNLYDAHMGTPNAPTDSKHDSPSGYVYTWRWDLGKAKAAFYGSLVSKRPTWVSWDTLPLVLGAFMERREPEEMHAEGLLSGDALRIARTLGSQDRAMTTDEVRKEAGFPAGKEHRGAYLKALEELESRMIAAKPFLPDGEMAHALTAQEYGSAVEAAWALDARDALTELMKRLLPEWLFVRTKPFARALRIPEDRLVPALRGAGLTEIVEGRERAFTSVPLDS